MQTILLCAVFVNVCGSVNIKENVAKLRTLCFISYSVLVILVSMIVLQTYVSLKYRFKGRNIATTMLSKENVYSFCSLLKTMECSGYGRR